MMMNVCVYTCCLGLLVSSLQRRTISSCRERRHSRFTHSHFIKLVKCVGGWNGLVEDTSCYYFLSTSLFESIEFCGLDLGDVLYCEQMHLYARTVFRDELLMKMNYYRLPFLVSSCQSTDIIKRKQKTIVYQNHRIM